MALVTLVLLLLFIGSAFRRAELNQLETSIGQRVNLTLPHIALEMESATHEDLCSLLRDHADAGDFRLTLIDRAGNVIAESDTLPEAVPNLRNRPEILVALLGRRGSSIRESQEFGYTYCFVAEPIIMDGMVIGVLRGGERIIASRWELLKRTVGS
ncbi:MAG: hypothetical protein IPP40_06580 [bacterium]|nr:hypothetical protein [bacterium]